MNLLEYMRRRNKMTLSEWEDTFEKKEREIIVLRHEECVKNCRRKFLRGHCLQRIIF